MGTVFAPFPPHSLPLQLFPCPQVVGCERKYISSSDALSRVSWNTCVTATIKGGEGHVGLNAGAMFKILCWNNHRWVGSAPNWMFHVGFFSGNSLHNYIGTKSRKRCPGDNRGLKKAYRSCRRSQHLHQGSQLLQGIQCPLLASVGTCIQVYIPTHRCTNTHIIFKN